MFTSANAQDTPLEPQFLRGNETFSSYGGAPEPGNERRGRGGGTAARRDGVRVFRQFSGLKPVPSKRLDLVPPGCRLVKPCRDTPAGTDRVLRKRNLLFFDWLSKE